MTRKKLDTKDLCMIGVLTAVIVIMAQIQIPLPGVPFTMQTFAIMLAGMMLGSKKGFLATLIYVLLGAIGVPVFAGFTGGLQIIAGPTGGFILSFPFMAFAAGLASEIRYKSKTACILYLAIGLVINYACGIAVFCIITKASVMVGLTACVLPYVIPDIFKTVLAAVLSAALQKKAGESPMQLRPHHLLCTQNYAGKGYSPSFVKNMDHITGKLRTESETSIEIIFSTDSLCAHCPNLIGQNLCETNEKVNEMDRKMIAYFQLEEKSYIYQDLIKEINEKMTPEMVKDICGQCEWYSIC